MTRQNYLAPNVFFFLDIIKQIRVEIDSYHSITDIKFEDKVNEGIT